MPAVLVTGVVVALLAYILWASLERALYTFVGIIILVPSALVLPNALISTLTIPRLAILALGLRLIVAIRRREVSVDTLRLGPVHGAFFVFVAIALVNGVFRAAPSTSTAKAVSDWLGVVDQFLAFAIVLAVVRSLPNTRRLGRACAVIVGVSALIAVFERITGVSYARLVLEHQPGLGQTLNAIQLEQRGGGRVRAAAEFGLQYGWISAMVLPLVVAVAIRATKWRLRLVPLALVLTIYWSNSRSALVGIAVAVVIVALLARDRRTTVLGLVAVAVGGLLWVGAPSVRAPFTGASQTASTQSREDRLPKVMKIASAHPYGGLGFGGLVRYGLGSTDASFLVKYADLGVIGLASFVALLIVLLFSSVNCMRGPPSWGRLFGVAAFAGIVAGLLGAASFDLFELAGSAIPFWIIGAIAVGLAERNPEFVSEVRFSRTRVAIVPVALAIGFAVRLAVPTHAAVATPFDTIPMKRVAESQGSQVYIGKFYRSTFCIAARTVLLPPHVELECSEASLTPGYGNLRVDGPTRADAESGTATVIDSLQSNIVDVHFHPSEKSSGQPTWARTAPVWMATGGLILAVFCPVPRRRRGVRPRPQTRTLVST